MEGNLVSVIIPVFNAERYLAACLDSIISQSYRNLEIIIINDGSTDFSLEIAEKYADNDDRITVYSYDNSGLSEARNKGLSVATGDYISFVDADDLLLPNAFEVMLGLLQTYDADLVEGKTIREQILENIKSKQEIKVEVFSPKDAISKILYQDKLLPSAWGKLYKRNLFDSLEFEKGILYEDLDIFYKVINRCHKMIWIDYPVYFYRITEGSILNSWNPKRLDVLKVTERIESYIQENYPDLLPAAKDRRLSANFNMFALCSIHGQKKEAANCWQHIKNHRKQSLFNPKVRLKNKAGILLSYLGKNVFNILSRQIYVNNK